jgi:hypothetical protein
LLFCSFTHGEADYQADRQADENRGDSVRPDSLGRTGQAEIMRERGSDYHAEYKHGCISVPFSGHEQLPSGATSGQGKGQASQNHAREIPYGLGMGDRLSLESDVKLAENQVTYKGENQKGQQTAEEMRLPEKNQVPESAHGAKTATLGDCPDNQPNDQGYEKGRVHGSRTLEAVEKHAAFVLSGYLGINKHEDKEKEHYRRHNQSD